MILLVGVAVLSGIGVMVALWPFGWVIALAAAPIGASLMTAVVALALIGFRSQGVGCVVPTRDAAGLVDCNGQEA